MILANHGIIASSSGVSQFDADALSFITAASISDSTQQSAINTLVTDLKTYNIWTKMKAIYPFVGGSAISHSYNLKDINNFSLVFSGGGTHGSGGYFPQSNAYANTGLNVNSVNFPSIDSLSATIYSRSDTNIGVNDFGVHTGVAKRFFEINIRDTNILYAVAGHSGSSYLTNANTDSLGLYTVNRINSTDIKVFKNGNTLTTASQSSSSTVYGNQPVYISALNNNGTPLYYSNRNIAFASFGDGLTDTEALNTYTAVQAYQTTLNRQV
jgi:hypothetical protein